MNVPDEDLTDLADRVETLRVAMYRASGHLRDDMPDMAQGTLLQVIMGEMPGLHAKLASMGAVGSDHTPEMQDVSLEMLQSDTNQSLRYYLGHALAEAKRVDEERGIEGGPVTQMLEILVDRVHLELKGPKGLD